MCRAESLVASSNPKGTRKRNMNVQPDDRSPNQSVATMVAIVAASIAVVSVVAIIAIAAVVLRLSPDPHSPAVQPVPQTMVVVVTATPISSNVTRTAMAPPASALPPIVTPTPRSLYIMTATSTAVGTTPQPLVSASPMLIPGTIITGLPQIKTATPLPSLPVTITITDEQATEQAIAIVRSDEGLALDDLQVMFTESDVRLTGRYSIDFLTVNVEATAQPIVSNERFRLQITFLRLGGVALQDSLVQTSVERALNGMFDRLLRGKRVQSFALAPGSLTIFALQQPGFDI